MSAAASVSSTRPLLPLSLSCAAVAPTRLLWRWWHPNFKELVIVSLSRFQQLGALLAPTAPVSGLNVKAPPARIAACSECGAGSWNQTSTANKYERGSSSLMHNQVHSSCQQASPLVAWTSMSPASNSTPVWLLMADRSRPAAAAAAPIPMAVPTPGIRDSPAPAIAAPCNTRQTSAHLAKVGATWRHQR